MDIFCTQWLSDRYHATCVQWTVSSIETKLASLMNNYVALLVCFSYPPKKKFEHLVYFNLSSAVDTCMDRIRGAQSDCFNFFQTFGDIDITGKLIFF